MIDLTSPSPDPDTRGRHRHFSPIDEPSQNSPSLMRTSVLPNRTNAPRTPPSSSPPLASEEEIPEDEVARQVSEYITDFKKLSVHDQAQELNRFRQESNEYMYLRPGNRPADYRQQQEIRDRMLASAEQIRRKNPMRESASSGSDTEQDVPKVPPQLVNPPMTPSQLFSTGPRYQPFSAAADQSPGGSGSNRSGSHGTQPSEEGSDDRAAREEAERARQARQEAKSKVDMEYRERRNHYQNLHGSLDLDTALRLYAADYQHRSAEQLSTAEQAERDVLADVVKAGLGKEDIEIHRRLSEYMDMFYLDLKKLMEETYPRWEGLSRFKHRDAEAMRVLSSQQEGEQAEPYKNEKKRLGILDNATFYREYDDYISQGAQPRTEIEQAVGRAMQEEVILREERQQRARDSSAGD